MAKTNITTYPAVGGGGAVWGGITGTLSAQSDLDLVLANKAELPIAQSDVTGLVSDLAGKSPTTHNHTLTSLSEKSYNSLTDKPTIPTLPIAQSDVTNLVSDLGGKESKITRTTQTNLTCDFASTNLIIATVTGNQSFTLSNVPTDKVVTIIIINTGGGDITLPNTADYFASETWTHAAGGIREYSLLYDGTNRYWQVSEELT